MRKKSLVCQTGVKFNFLNEMNIKKGDQIKILSGKDRGKTGSVLKVFPKEDSLVVDGLNLFKKRSRPKKQGEKGEMVNIPRPLFLSKVMLVCKSCKKPTRVGFRLEGEKRFDIVKNVKLQIKKMDRRDTIKNFLEKIVVNAGVGRLSGQPHFNDKLLPQILKDLAAITGQHPETSTARKSVAGFKLR